MRGSVGGGPVSAGARRWALLAVAVAVFCVQLDAFGLNLALPQIGRDLHAGGAGLPWVVSAYLLSTGALMWGAGRLGDLFGRRRSLVVGLVVFGVASLACALAPTLAVLVGARVVQGVGAALAMPVGLALLSNAYPTELRGRAIGWALGIGGTATACGPFIGGALTDAVSWRAVFWLNVPLALLGAACAARTAESHGAGGSRTVDVGGLVGVTAALAGLCVLIDRAPHWPRSAVLAGAVSVAALLTLLVRRARAAGKPLVGPELSSNGRYLVLTLAGAVANTATVLFLFVVPLTLQEQWDLPVVRAGAAFLAPALAMALAGPVAGRVPPRAAAGVMAGCLCAGALVLGCLAVASSLTAYVCVAAAGGAVLGMSNALTLIATQAAVRPERAGEASGVTKTVITLAAGLGVALAGPVTDRGGDVGAESAADTVLLITASAGLTAGVALAVWIGLRPGVGPAGREESGG
ncbi:MFS transporter [Streptomyces sp. 796.1]|uniref:MFS transporter n=1 Tax=Streptomyces sp. 796.1 TaxID=3163029 RepID=UPI0039C97DE7